MALMSECCECSTLGSLAPYRIRCLIIDCEVELTCVLFFFLTVFDGETLVFLSPVRF